MRSGADDQTFAKWRRFSLFLMIGLLPAVALAAEKVKPDLPIGEDLHEAAPRPAKKGKAAPAAAQHGEESAHGSQAPTKGATKPAAPVASAANKDAHAPAAAPHGDSKDDHGTSSAPSGDKKDAAAHGEEKDPHATAPAQHGEEADPYAKDGAHGSKAQNAGDLESSSHSQGGEEKQKKRLLEGKVDPAIPSQGKGFFWFAVVFIVLALAIFIFT